MTLLYDPNQPIYTQAFDEVHAELEAMAPEAIEPIRYDIMSAVVIALGVVPMAKRLRSAIAAKFGEEAAKNVDRLEVFARACAKAHALHLTTLHGTDLEEMAGSLGQIRTVLTLEVQALIGQKKLPASVVSELVGGTSYRGLCLDVLQLVSALRHAWTDVASHTGVTVLELDRAEALANAFTTALGQNEQGAASSPTADMRRRAYTRFVRTYSEVRRYVTYFRWEEGDADELAPPFGAGRSRRTDDETPTDAPTDAPTTEVTGAPVTGAPVTGAPVTGAPAAPGETTNVVTPPAPVRPGMPGAPPFATG